MGQALSEPVTAKETSHLGNELYQVGSSCMQGWRINMEDAHVHILGVENDDSAGLFGVFDGHGGAKVAQYAGVHLPNKVIRSDEYVRGDYEEALRSAFLAIDEDMLKDETMKDELAGSTALMALIKNNTIYCSNVGDSRCIASVGGDVQALSFDHKPSNDEEMKRIVAAGGWVEVNRVNGNLALSRALGDFLFKQNPKRPAKEQIVTAYPDVMIEQLTADHEFIILACDGIWDVLTNEEVVEFVRARIAQGMKPEIICEELMTRCLAPDCHMGGLGCDNMTVVLVCLLQGGTYEMLSTRCALPPQSSASTTNGDVEEEDATDTSASNL